MTRVILVLVIIIVSFVFQYILSKKPNKWLGLIIPAVFFIVMSVFFIIAFSKSIYTVEDYGQFLLDYGFTGVIAQILKIAFIYFPMVIYLVIYLVCRRKFRHKDRPSKSKKEIKKMLAKDLD